MSEIQNTPATMAERVAAYKMTRSQDMPNIKTIAGQTITPVQEYFGTYEDKDGAEHHVLTIKTDDNRYYRTEVAAFQRDYQDYVACFGDMTPRPSITIIGKSSRKGNQYVTFSVNGLD